MIGVVLLVARSMIRVILLVARSMIGVRLRWISIILLIRGQSCAVKEFPDTLLTQSPKFVIEGGSDIANTQYATRNT